MITYLFVFLAFFSVSKTSENNNRSITIKHVYFDPTTSVTKERRDGVIIVESSNGSKSTICNDDFTSDDAMVICRMLGYSNGLNAFALITSKNSYKNFPIFYSNFSCQGDEATIEDCLTYDFKYAEQSCQSHEKDVHVYCNSPRIVSKQFPKGTVGACNGNIAEMRHGTSKRGLMVLKSENASFTLCGINNNFGQNEAQVFCKLLCFKNLRLARIISNYQVKGASIGGFRNMKCPPNAESLNECTNVYSDDSELCTPSDNIGIACDSQTFLPEPKPKILCDGVHMILKWIGEVFADVDHRNVNIMQKRGNISQNCSHVTKKNVNGDVTITVKLDKCNPKVSGTKDAILFRFPVERIFPKDQYIVDRNTQIFDATCAIKRKEVIDVHNVNLKIIKLNAVGNSVKFETKLELSTSFDFVDVLTMPYSMKIGTIIYGRITLLHAPVQIQLVLTKCYIYNAHSDTQILIEDKCAVKPDVKINPVNDTVIQFNYKSFAIRGENLPLFIKCETSKCGKSEIECTSSCQKA